MTEMINRFRVEVAFLAISIQTMFSESFKDFGDMLEIIVFVT
jgi:hypothetical protein